MDVRFVDILAEDSALVRKMALLARSWHIRGVKSHGTPAFSRMDEELLLPFSPYSPAPAAAPPQQQQTSAPARAGSNSGATPIDTGLASMVLTSARLASVLQQHYSGPTALPPVSVWYDLDALVASCAAVKQAFARAFLPKHLQAKAVASSSFSSPSSALFNHCFAVKAAPVSYLLRTIVLQGLGLETASILEVCGVILLLFLSVHLL
jgi:hypothetical protein